jgi:hypothetical protein
MGRKFRLIGPDDPADVFNDLDALRAVQSGGTRLPQRRTRTKETFARIPHERARLLARHKIDGSAWALLIELDCLIFNARGRNPVRLTNQNLKIHPDTKRRALTQLQKAGIISVAPQEPGRAPLVTHHWFPLQG